MKATNNKKKESIFVKRGFFIVLTVITALMVITVTMNLIMPEEESTAQLDQEVWERAVQQSAKTYDDALTSVYTEEAQAVTSTALPTETAPAEETQPPAESQTPEASASPSSAVVLLKPVAGSLAKDFSADELQYSETMEDWRVHEGMDFAADEGTDVVAAADGTVETVTEDGMMGASVTILHPDGMRTFYGNLQTENLIAAGTQVKAGETIGKVGRTAALEIIEPAHLHFEVLVGEKSKNPHDYLTDTVSDDE